MGDWGGGGGGGEGGERSSPEIFSYSRIFFPIENMAGGRCIPPPPKKYSGYATDDHLNKYIMYQPQNRRLYYYSKRYFCRVSPLKLTIVGGAARRQR